MNFGDERLPERFWSKCIPEPNSGCWLWTASIDSGGYGQLNLSNRITRAHRVTYETLVGPIPKGLVCDHLCRVRLCCNPSHIEVVTHRENVRRGDAGKARAAQNLAITHCPRGHAYQGENLYINRKGGRTCRECTRINGRWRRLLAWVHDGAKP